LPLASGSARGEYRVRYQIDDKDQIVYVLDIEHRRAYYPGRA
jgi:mRNA-degrading endonuclease RelE of RelBE toxin-antitoxin system